MADVQGASAAAAAAIVATATATATAVSAFTHGAIAMAMAGGGDPLALVGSDPLGLMPDTTAGLPRPPATRGRPRMNGPGRQKNQALRTSVTYAHKLAVINFYAVSRNINATVHEFYPELAPASAVASRKRQIYKWVKERHTIEEMCFKQTTATQSRRRNRGTATTLSGDAERELVGWIKEVKDRGEGVSAHMIKMQALAIADRYEVPRGSFQATWSWQQAFFKRHNIVRDKRGLPPPSI